MSKTRLSLSSRANFPSRDGSMAQLYKYLSSDERTELGAFLHSKIDAYATSRFLASCLAKHKHSKSFADKDRAESQGPESEQSTSLTSTKLLCDQNFFLSDYVASGDSSQISLLVCTLAKLYAERLVRKAKDIAILYGHQTTEGLLPSHVLKAYKCRVNEGLDPGFFMQMKSQSNHTTYSGNPKSSVNLKYTIDDANTIQDIHERLVSQID